MDTGSGILQNMKFAKNDMESKEITWKVKSSFLNMEYLRPTLANFVCSVLSHSPNWTTQCDAPPFSLSIPLMLIFHPAFLLRPNTPQFTSVMSCLYHMHLQRIFLVHTSLRHIPQHDIAPLPIMLTIVEHFDSACSMREALVLWGRPVLW